MSDPQNHKDVVVPHPTLLALVRETGENSARLKLLEDTQKKISETLEQVVETQEKLGVLMIQHESQSKAISRAFTEIDHIKEELPTLRLSKKIVFGLVALILTAVGVALVGMVVGA